MTASPHPSLADIQERICDIASKTLSIPRHEITPASRVIEDLHADSLDWVELTMAIEVGFDITIPDEPPNSVYKGVFTRSPFRVSDIAELVSFQWGTGRPDRDRWGGRIEQPASVPAIPFTQLGGRWTLESHPADQPLFERLPGPLSPPQFRRRSDGMRCVLLPAADVEIGSRHPEGPADERPLHRTRLDAFAIDAEPVSTTAYCRFLNSIHPTAGCLHDLVLLDPDDDREEHMLVERADGEWRPLPGVETFPMILVSWYAAAAYSLWANGLSWTAYRTREPFLPSEAQWEYAARGAMHRTFPGDGAANAAPPMRFGAHEPGATYAPATLPMAPVHERLGMSKFGLHHMAGNVWQWCLDWYDPGFYQRPDASAPNAVNRQPTGIRSERGGSWVGPADLCRSSYRRGRNPEARGRCLGFRCTSRIEALPRGS